MGDPFDIAIIGGGPAGYVAALRAVQLGARTALVEKAKVGGTCLNWGCIPTKALIRSAELVQEARAASQLGVDIAGAVTPNLPRMMARKDEVVKTLVSGVEALLAGGKVTVVRGEGRLVSREEDTWRLAAGDGEITARRVILATGSVPARLPVPGNDLPGVITSTEALALDHIPASLVIAGGNVIGLEFACLFWALGTKVTVLEMLPTVLPMADERFSARMLSLLRSRGVSVNVGAKVAAIEAAGQRAVRAIRDGTGGGNSSGRPGAFGHGAASL